MQVDSLSPFTGFILAPEEERSALIGSPLMLFYLKSKQSIYAQAAIHAQLALAESGTIDTTAELIKIARISAKVQVLGELIDEIVTAQAEAEPAAPAADEAQTGA